ncbi:MAG: translation initiation factor IF-3 [Firmicutes bacterium]|nr:translation initiation factor IF-3 [Bacillota bacterium]
MHHFGVLLGADRVFYLLLCFNKIGRVKTIKEYLINNQIRASEVRLLGAEGEQFGLVSLEEALKIADEQGYDLVNISPTTSPPVCKLMNYGKYKFDEQKKEKDARKKQKATEIKGMELSMRIEDHDMQFKAKQVRKFLQSGEKVRVVIKKVRGRLAAYANQGIDNMNKFYEMLSDVCEMEQKPLLSGTIITMMLIPKNTK